MKRIDWRTLTVGSFVGVFGGLALPSETLEERVEKLEAEVEDLRGHVVLTQAWRASSIKTPILTVTRTASVG